MGYAQCTGHCGNCGAFIMFNPVKVPSVRHPQTNQKVPLCEACFEKWNQMHRLSQGLPPVKLEPDAYGACDERELV